MQRYEYINKEWIISAGARRIYRIAARTSLGLYPLLIVWIVGDVPRILQPALRPMLLACVIGTAITAVGMEFFLFRFDDSPALKQIFWFCAMLFAPLGPALYCFIVYSHSKALESRTSNGVEEITARL